MASAPSPQQQQLPLPAEIYGSLVGPIDQAMVQKVFTALAAASQGGVKIVHVLFQSLGGGVGEAIALYNYLRSLPDPLDVHIYNGGTVSSSAVMAFLGAKHRYAAASATFMVHRTHATTALFNSPTAANANRLRELAKALEIEDARTRSILTANLNLTDEALDNYLINEIPIDADAALQCGLVTAIRDFAPPSGTKLFNL